MANRGRPLAPVIEGPPVVAAKVRVPRLRSLRLERLEARLGGVWEQRLGLVVAPAGSGKTTLLAGFVASLTDPVAWYRAESWDARPRTLLRHLQTAFASALAAPGTQPDGEANGGILDGRPWETVEDAADALESWPGERMLLVIDDLYALEGTEAERLIERLIDYAPSSLAVLAASRTQPGFNLSRRRLADQLIEIGSDELRFRSWEVERLFREIYEEAVPPQELAALARLTEGWAAGLQLFHLAIQGKSADERHRLLAGGGASARLVREYLTRNVLADLPADLRTFLVETSVFGRMTAPLCDRLLGRHDSRAFLEDLERRQIFTTRLDDDGSYRYHEILRVHLEAMLVERDGDEETRARYRRAGELLTADEEIGEALGAFARAGDRAAIDRLLRSRGEQLVEGSAPAAWLDALPPAVLRHDPWLILANARRARDDGQWESALAGLERAELGFGVRDAAVTARRERLGLAAWLEPRPAPATDWSSLIRAAVARDPLGVLRSSSRLEEPMRGLVAGYALLLAGRVLEARRELAVVADHPRSAPIVVASAALGAGVSAFLAGDPGGRAHLDVAAHAAERAQAGWLARMIRASWALEPNASEPVDVREMEDLRHACANVGDRWGEQLIRLIQGWVDLSSPNPDAAVLDPVVALARGTGAGVLEAWAGSMRALAMARAEMPDARDAAIASEVHARTAGAGGARMLSYLALADADPLRATDDRALAEAVAEETGLRPPVPPVSPAAQARLPSDAPPAVGATQGTSTSATPPAMTILCLGRFRIEVDGRPVDDRSIRPRARSLLHLLAIHAGRAVHREVIEAAIWPAGDPERGPGKLHVAVSSIRRLLEPGMARGGSTYLVRDGDAYRLSLPITSHVDVIALEDAVNLARTARDRRDLAAATAGFAHAVDLYAGDLLVEEGPAEWVVERREHYRGLAVQAAQGLAELELDRGPGADSTAAADACLAGLAIDRYHDPFWRLLIQAREVAGDRGAATRVREDYRHVLAELGLPDTPDGNDELLLAAVPSRTQPRTTRASTPR